MSKEEERVTQPVVMPRLGESIVEATVVKWLVVVGDVVHRGQPMAEVETDKASSEIPAPCDGTVTEVLREAGMTVEVGQVISRIDPTAPKGIAHRAATPRWSPAVRRIALDSGLDPTTLKGSGRRGRVTRDDMIRALEARREHLSPKSRGSETARTRVDTSSPQRTLGVRSEHRSTATEARDAVAGEMSQGSSLVYASPNGSMLANASRDGSVLADGLPGGSVLADGLPDDSSSTIGALDASPSDRSLPSERSVPFSRRRKTIARNLRRSLDTAVHVFAVAEIDMHRVMRAKAADSAMCAEDGPRPTVLAYAIESLARALCDFPEINATVHDETLVLHREINIGIAVDTPEGLVVPVLHRAEALDVLGIARAVHALTSRAREGRITPGETSGGTFTVSNPGKHGNLFGASIIRPPEVAILRLGAVTKRAVVREIDGQDAIVVRPMMYAALSYDHRVIDGRAGNAFLARFSALLEEARPAAPA